MHLNILIQTVGIVASVILLTRLQGVRSFSKMSGFDFAITVAMGSVLASTIMAPDQQVSIGITALTCLFFIQFCIAQARARGLLSAALDNEPILIMDGAKILDDNLKTAGMTRDDLYGKLREANAFDMNRVKAVVAESTGDVSVLHGPEDGPEISNELLASVRRS